LLTIFETSHQSARRGAQRRRLHTGRRPHDWLMAAPDHAPISWPTANGGGVWIRWAIGLTFVGMVSTIGFAVNEARQSSALRQQVSDDKEIAGRDRSELREEMRYRLDKLDDQVTVLTRIVLNAQTPAPTAVATRPVPAF